MPRQIRSSIARLIISTLIALGIVTLVISIFYTSSFLALLGLALVFWSTILLYVTPTKHVFIDLLTSIGQPGLANIERVLQSSQVDHPGIYLSTRNHYFDRFSDVSLYSGESCILFIPEIQDFKSFNLETQQCGVCISPPGESLCRLLEQEAGIRFDEIELRKLQSVLPKTLAKGLEFVETIDIRNIDDVIIVELSKSVFDGICKETDAYPRTHRQVGCLLNSAIACALAKATGKPIIIEKESHDPQQQITQIQYRILIGTED